MPNSDEINELRAEVHALRAEVAKLKHERAAEPASDIEIAQPEIEDSVVEPIVSNASVSNDIVEQSITDESENMINEPVLEVKEQANEGTTGYKVAHIVIGILLIILGSFLSYKTFAPLINYAYDPGYKVGHDIGYAMTYDCEKQEYLGGEPANTIAPEYSPLDVGDNRGKKAFGGD